MVPGTSEGARKGIVARKNNLSLAMFGIPDHEKLNPVQKAKLRASIHTEMARRALLANERRKQAKEAAAVPSKPAAETVPKIETVPKVRKQAQETTPTSASSSAGPGRNPNWAIDASKRALDAVKERLHHLHPSELAKLDYMAFRIIVADAARKEVRTDIERMISESEARIKEISSRKKLTSADTDAFRQATERLSTLLDVKREGPSVEHERLYFNRFMRALGLKQDPHFWAYIVHKLAGGKLPDEGKQKASGGIAPITQISNLYNPNKPGYPNVVRRLLEAEPLERANKKVEQAAGKLARKEVRALSLAPEKKESLNKFVGLIFDYIYGCERSELTIQRAITNSKEFMKNDKEFAGKTLHSILKDIFDIQNSNERNTRILCNGLIGVIMCEAAKSIGYTRIKNIPRQSMSHIDLDVVEHVQKVIRGIVEERRSRGVVFPPKVAVAAPKKAQPVAKAPAPVVRTVTERRQATPSRAPQAMRRGGEARVVPKRVSPPEISSGPKSIHELVGICSTFNSEKVYESAQKLKKLFEGDVSEAFLSKAARLSALLVQKIETAIEDSEHAKPLVLDDALKREVDRITGMKLGDIITFRSRASDFIMVYLILKNDYNSIEKDVRKLERYLAGMGLPLSMDHIKATINSHAKGKLSLVSAFNNFGLK